VLASFPVETTATEVLVPYQNRDRHVPLPTPIGMVMRDQFDAFLIQQAVAAGAELRDATTLTGLVEDGKRIRLVAGIEPVTARFVIGADGAAGSTARLAGFAPLRHNGVAIEAEVAVPDTIRARYEHAALLDFQTIRGGYAWIFGKRDHLSVGLGVFRGTLGPQIRPALERFLAVHPDLREAKLLLRRGHLIPLAGGRGQIRRGGVLLAGDAAALADPLTAEGISYALASGRRAGTTVLAALARGEGALPAYERYVQRDLLGDLRYARLIATLCYRFPHAVVSFAASKSRLRDTHTAAVAGAGSYRSLVLLMARHAPALLQAVVRTH
jgi:flavin-dependent dehydrogenase